MTGEYILHDPPKKTRRIDYLLHLGAYAAAASILIVIATSAFLATVSEYDAAVTLLVFSLGIAGYVYSTVVNRQLQVTEYAQNSLSYMQSVWHEIRNDESLLKTIANPVSIRELKPEARLKLRFFLGSFLDVQSLIIHYIRRGYFRHPHEFAIVYENTIKSVFQYPYFIDIWQNNGDWGSGRIRDEYGSDLVYVVDKIVQDIVKERT